MGRVTEKQNLQGYSESDFLQAARRPINTVKAMNRRVICLLEHNLTQYQDTSVTINCMQNFLRSYDIFLSLCWKVNCMGRSENAKNKCLNWWSFACTYACSCAQHWKMASLMTFSFCIISGQSPWTSASCINITYSIICLEIFLSHL